MKTFVAIYHKCLQAIVTASSVWCLSPLGAGATESVPGATMGPHQGIVQMDHPALHDRLVRDFRHIGEMSKGWLADARDSTRSWAGLFDLKVHTKTANTSNLAPLAGC